MEKAAVGYRRRKDEGAAIWHTFGSLSHPQVFFFGCRRTNRSRMDHGTTAAAKKQHPDRYSARAIFWGRKKN